MSVNNYNKQILVNRSQCYQIKFQIQMINIHPSNRYLNPNINRQSSSVSNKNIYTGTEFPNSSNLSSPYIINVKFTDRQKFLDDTATTKRSWSSDSHIKTIADESSIKKDSLLNSSSRMNAALRTKNKLSMLNQSMVTPKKGKKNDKDTSHSRNNNNLITSLRQVETVESKINQQSPYQISLQQSEVIFKGSRDVKDIVPMKLIYDNEEQYNMEGSLKNIYLKTVRKSSEWVSLVRELPSLSLVGKIILKQNEDVFICQHSQILEVYAICSGDKNQKVLIVEPYEYTFQELLEMGLINKDNYTVALQKISIGLQCLFDSGYNSQIQNNHRFLDHLYYIHGQFKILPIYYKKQKITPQNYLNILESEIKSRIG